MNIELLSITPNAEETIDKAARTCYKSVSKEEKRAGFLKGIIKSGHESVIEHASATFKISGVSRALTHQLVRHRMASYSQQSQRYCSFDKSYGNTTDDWYVTPPSIQDHPGSNEVDLGGKEQLYRQFMVKCEEIYNKLIDMGVKPEDARFILPNAAKTEIVMTANFREWRHFIKMRADSHAQWEIQELARAILDELCKHAPNIFEDLKESLNEK